MSHKQNRQASGRMCTACGRPSGRRRACTQCSPTRAGQAHRDKYSKETA